MIARLLALAIAGALLAGAAAVQNIATGVYLCTVDQRAGIGANHLGRIGPDLKPDVIWFWHSAFEYPGGKDVVLAVRSGTYAREKKTP